ncbi:unnamed protein product, partial [Eruca vesicaria subsp. sativa]|nr:unnamed protein product [Eruca vesicaria subsp. sativa]
SVDKNCEECRQEHIERDEAKEKKQNLSYSVKSAMRRKEQRNSSSSPTRSRDYACTTELLLLLEILNLMN